MIGIVMGSASDKDVMDDVAKVLDAFECPFEMRVVSAHRTPFSMLEYAKTASGRGIQIIIAGAGGAAHLPGMLASATTLPVIGVPIALKRLDGLDSLLSIVQMPRGVPVATVAIGGGENAGLLAIRMLSVHDAVLAERMSAYQRGLEDHVALQNNEMGS
jgi:5-(carboxyamino)imidazole ribonucleotide mutase